MTYTISGPCPACGGELQIAKYRCGNCQTEISGKFVSCVFCQMPADLKRFITVFLVKRGNIKLVERELGISYPTVRKELKRVIEALGYDDEDEVIRLSHQEKLSVLERLEKGEIDYASAMGLLDGNEE